MSSVPQTAATLDDLHRVEGKAELIAGRIVYLMPTGFRPGQVGGRIYRSLDDHAAITGRGVALPDNVGFIVPELSSGRQSFSPDASFSWDCSRRMRWTSSMGRRRSRSRSEARATTARRPRSRWPRSVASTSRQALRWFGTSIP